ncbi:hypothetical protein GOODEAATRI_024168, partial [Goodea atripinnis]
KGAVDGMENIGMPAQGFVIWDTKQGRILSDNPYAETFQHLVTLARGQAKGKLTTGDINPILFSIGGIQSNPYHNPNITIMPPTLRCGNMSSGFYMYLGVDLPRWIARDQGRIVRINLVSSMAKGHEIETPVVQIDYNTLTPDDVIQGALEFTEYNLWLTWMARESTMSNCIACAAARPTGSHI